MTRRHTPLAVHLIGACAASAIAAFWVLRLIVPDAPVVPAAPTPVVLREPDATLAARLFGDLNAAPALAARNVQVSGVFVAGRASSAVIAVDGHAPRAVLLGQEAAPGMRLVEVRADGVALEGDAGRAQYAVPPVSLAKASLPAPLFRRDGNTLTAPSQEPAAPARAGGPRIGAPAEPTLRSGMLLAPQRGADEPGARPAMPGSGSGARGR